MIFSKRVARLLGAASLTAVLAVSACTGSGQETGDDDTAGEGVILQAYGGASGQFVENYNPLSPTVLEAIRGMVYESLFYFNPLQPLSAKPEPLLGESYVVNEDGTVVDVTIKTGVTWSDGEPFTAEDVAFTYNTVRDNPELNTTGNGPAAEVTGENTVRLSFDRPAFPDVPNVLAVSIVPEHIFSEMENVVIDPNLEPVGTGPMVLGEFTAQSYLLEKNDSYRNAEDVAVPGVRYFSLSGNQAATDKLLAGELDMAGIAIPDVETVLAPYEDLHILTTTFQQVVLTTCSDEEMGCEGPQTDPTVRQAMALAIDREQINQLAYYGRGLEISPTFGVVGRDDEQISDEFPPMSMEPDVAGAKELLEDAGWELGSDGVYAKDGERLSFDVIVTSGYTDYISTLDILKQQLAEAGIEINPQQQANAEILSARSQGNFQVAIDGIFGGPTADLYYIYNNNFSSAQAAPVGENGNPYGNVSKFSDPTVDAAIQAAAATQDPAEKVRLYGEIQDVIVPAMPYIPLINNQGFGTYSTANYTGWPTEEDPYVQDFSIGLLLERLEPVN
ncbi:ABC transporter substrate-binding protein [Pseudactinotalea terrae]|uniref:ABC transporter substrate-binding protein n=1 Tax=Pseudactinotalea terrae TaxID=1743262 RepID=UPI0012E2B536|nr:ABC transporter substrate-binding protein [Pseudactinotalea terrae]